MTDSAMILHENGSAMSAYQDRDDVRELGDRLLAMHPAAAEVGPAAMRAAAQLALMLGANPLPGVNEVHVWKDGKGRSCMSLGINYWRRKGAEWGGYLYEVRPRPMKPAELTEYGIPSGTMAAICKGVRAADMIRYKQLGFTTAEIWDMCGRTGVGTQSANEYAKSGRPNIWTSLKRAETDMLRQLFPAEVAEVERQTVTPGAPIVTVEPAEEDDITEESKEVDLPAVEEGRYTLDDANADLGFSAAPTNGKPAASTGPGPLDDDEQVVYEAPAREFIPAAAALIGTDEDDVKARLHALGYERIPGKPDERVAAYRKMKAAPLAGAAQAAMPLDDPDAQAAAAATARGEID